MKAPSPLATIIIPVHNQLEYLIRCVASIKRAHTCVSFDVLLVDDCSSPEVARALDALLGVRVIRNFSNLGFLRSCNRAAVNARGEFLVFLNSDTEVTDHWLDELIATHSRFPHVGLVGSKLLYPDRTLQECGGIIWRDGTGWNYGRNDDPEEPQYNYTRKTDYVSAAAALIKKSLFLNIGMFDRRYSPAYYEDTDLAFKVRERAYEVYVEPKSLVIHHEGKSNGTSLQSGIKKHQVTNRYRFHRKWSNTLEADHFPSGKSIQRARDRSRHQKKILVIDHYVPKFDRDAGSRCIDMYLQLMIEIGLSVSFLPDNFHRDPNYAPPLERMGVEILYGPYYQKYVFKWLEDNIDDFDYAFLSRPHISVKYIDLLKRHASVKTIYFGHDIHHLRLQLEKTHHPDISEDTIETVKKQEFALWSSCDYVLQPSADEVNYIRRIVPEANVLEVPIYFFPKGRPSNRKAYNDSSGFLFVANFNHPPNRDGLKWFVEDVFPIIANRLKSPRVTIVGSAIPNEVRRLAGPSFHIKCDVSDDELRKEYLRARVSIVPLRFGAGVKGKVLESLYYELPTVTTKFGAQGVPGIEQCSTVADDQMSFAEACIRLHEDRDAWRQAMGLSRNILFKKYSTEHGRRLLESLFDIDNRKMRSNRDF